MRNQTTIMLAIPFVLGWLLIAALFGIAKQSGQTVTEILPRPEFISARGLQSTDTFWEPRVNLRTGDANLRHEYWTDAIAADWLLLNGVRGAGSCPVLRTLATVNLKPEVVSVADIHALSIAAQRTPRRIQVVVPRFKAISRDLNQCPGISYNAVTGELHKSGKRIAFLTPYQPRNAQVLPLHGKGPTP